mmetsp:Transcript_14550/g.41932  ORF Transcript_14550/g.41932 Transcript_14550/m.41932 type:complete len:337 (+) Transcript_14550:253-1263(+)
MSSSGPSTCWRPLSPSEALDAIRAASSPTHPPAPGPSAAASGASQLVVVVPYRQREHHLRRFLPAMSGLLTQEQRGGMIMVVEQASGMPFNRGLLFNAAVATIQRRMSEMGCAADRLWYIFHDVDTLPNEQNAAAMSFYRSCPPPLCVRHAYGHPWALSMVFAIRHHDYLLTKGFSNHYWGWGWEDNDFERRCRSAGVHIDRRAFTDRLSPPAAGSDSESESPCPFIELDKPSESDLAARIQQPDAQRNQEVFARNPDDHGLSAVERLMDNGCLSARLRFVDVQSCPPHHTDSGHGRDHGHSHCDDRRVGWILVSLDEARADEWGELLGWAGERDC